MGKKNIKNQANSSTAEQKADQEENKEEKNAGNSNIKEALYNAHVHCQGCSDKLSHCLQGYFGVEEVVIDRDGNKITVKGQKIDVIKVLERLEKKYSKHVELISPKPKPNTNNKDKKEPVKKDEPKVKNLVLKMYMHCEGCATDIKKRIERMAGIMVVEPDMEKSTVLIRGTFDPPNLVELIRKRLGKYVEILKQQDEVKTKSPAAHVEKCAEDKSHVFQFQYPPQYSTHHIYPSQLFSDDNVFSCSIM